MLKKLPLWVKIFIGMGIGILLGLVAVWTNLEKFTTDWIQPWGNIFLKLLKMIAVPLIFVSLVKGISSWCRNVLPSVVGAVNTTSINSGRLAAVAEPCCNVRVIG